LVVLMLVSLSSCCCKRKTAASFQIEDVASGSIILKAEVPAGTTWAAVESDYDRENILSIEGDILYKTDRALRRIRLQTKTMQLLKQVMKLLTVCCTNFQTGIKKRCF